MFHRLLLPGLLLLVPALAADDAGYAQSVQQWREQRAKNLLAETSWLALIGRHLLTPGTHTLGSAEGSGIRLAAGPDRLGVVTLAPDRKVTLALADGVDARIGDTDARTAELVHAGDKPTYVRFGTVNFYIMERGDELYLRVRDTESPRRRHFAGLAWYPVDAAWRVEAQWVPFAAPRMVPITNVLGQTTPEPVHGKAVFTIAGRAVELLPLTEGDELFFIFTDETAPDETYGAARFLYTAAPKDGKVVLDFNRAYNPPCAFTPFATCPLPPKENRLPLRVTAGEKNYPGGH